MVAAWNGLAIAALAEAGALLDRQDYLDAAVRCAALLQDLHWVDGRLRRVSRDGVVGRHLGVLEDYADVAEGLLALYSATGDLDQLRGAHALLEVVLEQFPDGNGGFWDTAQDAHDHEPLVRRPQDPTDNATPSGAAAAAGALLSLRRPDRVGSGTGRRPSGRWACWPRCSPGTPGSPGGAAPSGRRWSPVRPRWSCSTARTCSPSRGSARHRAR